jgi:hypothetical protein
VTEAQTQIIQRLDRILAATGGGVTNVSGTSPIASSGGKTPAISIAPATGSDPGSMSAADKTKLDGLSAPSGGVIGTASFTALGGSISNLVCDGALHLNHVEYQSTGRYVLYFDSEQQNTRYVVVASLGGNALDDTWSYTLPLAGKSTASFILEARYKGALSDECDHIEVAVLRLSQ